MPNRTYIIAKQIEAKNVKDALKREGEGEIIGCVPSSAHALEQLSAAIGTPIVDYEALADMGFDTNVRKRTKRT